MNSLSSPSPAAEPWWRVGTVWLVIAGPLVVVVASFITLGLAITHPDPVLEPTQAGGSTVSSTQSSAKDAAHLPAIQGRNHAATGGK
ncbi:hypothetical protein [Sphaerotilus hippei]|uniref:hypothetical protein n=1 Tax=Sphaerotilus hippei TaxID=744406 RepID=UPI002873126D|nr:hypothetical protein [Sphaerotilus hippei]